ncbi:amino acid permease [Ulvibacter antarcticus]|uniref:Cation-chloride cotransporter (CCC family) n=1 Tax=Ulvibacter antarcticus TaxID=442714 RepID=A0A3L9YD23_9FLAO|nr:amino acid permease [Ulvibacter antarcticus]RMA58596.1 cation-chloride cotransporter (CCC family) [Ulvibacter antarcticus]
METTPSKPVKKFGMMAGVFTPTFLTILGVIMYIRHPWVVGNAGIVGTFLIIIVAVSITFSTALSLSSITTNIRIGSGGAFSLISQSLGLEIGGAIGIPFFFSQAIAVAMYIFGFREGLQSLLPEMSPVILDIMVFALVMAIAFISTSFAFKIQYVIMVIIILSIFSILGGLFVNELNYDFVWFGNYEGSIENNFSGTSFWLVFAVFFPAVTGVMAGANMSGDLKNPRKSIPTGTISAVIITTIVYMGMIFVAALLATPTELLENYNVFIDKAYYAPIVLAGLLGATLSSALGSFVGAPRILLALGEKRILPKSDLLSKTNKKGEPFNAMLVTAVIVVIGLSLRDLNTIAPLITMFFMITYAMVNIVALIEQSLSLPSFRPTLKIPIIVPLIGAFGSLTVMFIINAAVALASLVLIVFFYFYLVKKKLKSEAGDSRSGLFTALAEWSTKKTTQLSPTREVRSWRPDLLIPVTAPKEIRSSFKLIESIVAPKGSVKFLAVKHLDKDINDKLQNFLPEVISRLKSKNIATSHTYISGEDLSTSLKISMQALNAAFFKPNSLFFTVNGNEQFHQSYEELIKIASMNNYGVILYVPFENVGLSLEKNLSLWLSNFPKNWRNDYDLGNNDLAILTSLLLAKNWKGELNAKVALDEEGIITQSDISILNDLIRFPVGSNIESFTTEAKAEYFGKNSTDLNILSLPSDSKIEELIKVVNQSRTSAIFCMDSTTENALV